MSDNRIKGLSIVLFFTCALFFLSSAVHVNSLPSPSSSSRLLPEAVENNNGAPEKGGYYSLFPSSLTSWLPGFLRERRTDLNEIAKQLKELATKLENLAKHTGSVHEQVKKGEAKQLKTNEEKFEEELKEKSNLLPEIVKASVALFEETHKSQSTKFDVLSSLATLFNEQDKTDDQTAETVIKKFLDAKPPKPKTPEYTKHKVMGRIALGDSQKAKNILLGQQKPTVWAEKFNTAVAKKKASDLEKEMKEMELQHGNDSYVQYATKFTERAYWHMISTLNIPEKIETPKKKTKKPGKKH
eukprot:Nk52_evm7s317 gene=Nk52_evmTU7s317